MRSKFNKMFKDLQDSNMRTTQLEMTVNKLHTENVQMKTDLNILRDEHTEVLHRMFEMDKQVIIMQKEANYMSNEAPTVADSMAEVK
jgi:hypothetical protein